MKIVNRTEFLALPIGVVYSLYEPTGNLEGLFVKNYSLSNDWYYLDFLESVDCKDSGEFLDLMLSAEKDGTSFRNHLETIERDGMFEADQLFCVYDRSDVQRLTEALQFVLQTYPEAGGTE